MSYEGGNANTYDLDDGEIPPDTYQQTIDTPGLRLRGGDASATTDRGCWTDISTAPGNDYNTRQSHSCRNAEYDSDCQEIPPPIDLPRRSERLRAAARTARITRTARVQFDFNDNTQPLPWNQREQPKQIRDDTYTGRGNFKVRRFTDCADAELLSYLAQRSISPHFLHEIDLFLQGHPELASCPEGRDTLLQVSKLPPLEAYLYFLKGYTRPARYIDGIIKTEYFQLPLDFTYCPLRKKYDSELVDFFNGYQYRHDIIDRIDEEVHVLVQDISYGRPIPVGLRKLVCYAIWGNPVDAYKWYEYSYQQEFMPHHYLPEHVVLSYITRADSHVVPQASADPGRKNHGAVRYRMARACDQGVDVLDVLLQEYRLALVKRGHRRIDTDKMCAEAKERLENERRNPTGAEIVDMIMNGVYENQARPRQAVSFKGTQSRPHGTYSFGTRQIRLRGGKHRMTIRRGPAFLEIQGNELRQAKTSLQRLYAQEQSATAGQLMGLHKHLRMIRTSRAIAERRYVNCLIRYQRDAYRMDSDTAGQLQRQFTRDKMNGVTVPSGDFLLSMYPRELN